MDPAVFKVFPEDSCPIPQICLALGSFGSWEEREREARPYFPPASCANSTCIL